MGTIVDYLEHEFDSFEERPFGPVDSAVLAAFCMVDLGCIMPGPDEGNSRSTFGGLLRSIFARKQPPLHFKDVPHAEFYDTLFAGPNPKNTKALMLALGASPRFREVTISEYISIHDPQSHTQFAAMTFTYKNEFSYIGFRGTDNTLTGWHEDFNMAFMRCIPSQEQAREYLETASKNFSHSLYVGGHSKGGNLAVYAARKAVAQTQERLIQIFNHDGPGFRPGTTKDTGYDAICKRIHKTVPYESLVGMLMESPETYHVVASTARGILQHELATWEVEGTRFVSCETINENAVISATILNEWLTAFPDEELSLLTHALFSTLETMPELSVPEIMCDGRKLLNVLLEVGKRADPSTKFVINHAIRDLSDITMRHIGHTMTEALLARASEARASVEESKRD